jgi:signal transduction histidine kinase/tetratricopeptide (TPR) repeat protein
MISLFPKINLKPLLTALFCIAQILVYSQNEKIENLRAEIYQMADSKEKVDLQLDLARQFYLAIEFDSTTTYLSDMRALAVELNYPEGEAESYYLEGMVLKRRGELENALKAVGKYIEICKSIDNEKKLAKGYWLMGSVSREKGNIQTSAQNLKKSLALYEKMGDTNRMLSVLHSLGNLALDIANYDSAVIYYHKVIDFCEMTGNETGLATAYDQLAKVYLDQGQYSDAKRYINMSMVINKQYERPRELYLNYAKLASIALQEDSLDMAMSIYRKVEEINRRIENAIGLAHTYNNIGEIYQDKKEYSKAMENYEKALGFYRQEEHFEGMSIALKNKADTYVAQGRYGMAKQILDSAMSFASRIGKTQITKDIYALMARNYYLTGDYENAYDHFELYHMVYDSLYNLDRTELINDMNLKYERQKDRAEILRLDLDLQQQKAQRNAFLWGGLSVVALVIFTSLYFRQRSVKDHIIKEQRIRQLEEEKKLLAAKALVEGQEDERKRIARELHDGLGVLLSTARMQFTSIGDKSPANRSVIERAAKLLEQASGDVRKISHNMMPGLLTKLGLFDALIELFEKISETEKLKVEYEVPEEGERLPENSEIMLYRIVQELVNNTLKHAGASDIIFRIKQENGVMHVFYQDNGKGFDVEAKMKAKSIGLTSIQSRVNFLNGKMRLRSAPGEGVLFEMEMPYG